MNKIVSDAMVGSTAASLGLIAVRFNGFNWITLTAILYLTVCATVLAGFKERSGLSSGFLHRLVLVAEGEEMKMKKLATGEKYKIKGDLEKLQ
ncbi:hypothetical protein [Candidatus Nanohalococcus occultus]